MKNKEEIDLLDDEIKSMSKNVRIGAFHSIIYTADVINQYLAVKMSEMESRRTSFGILNALITHGGSMGSTELSKIVFRTKCAITRVVDTLVKDGLVKRISVKGDRRVKKIIITQKGIDLIRKTMLGRMQMADDSTSYLSDGEIEPVMEVLHNLRKHLLSKINPDTGSDELQEKYSLMGH
jgi:DNA-binding MarR family transcriptional regulator